MKFGINQSISQTITQLSCIQLETPSSRLWNFWWIKTYTTLNTIGPGSVPVDHVYDAGILSEPMLTFCQYYLRNKLI